MIIFKNNLVDFNQGNQKRWDLPLRDLNQCIVEMTLTYISLIQINMIEYLATVFVFRKYVFSLYFSEFV